MKPAEKKINDDQILIYQNADGTVKVEVRMEDETIWLSQQMIAKLFGVTKSTISEHFSSIFESKEITRQATVRKFRTVQKEGNREVSRDLEFYNLDAIISVGYRVNSYQATQFRIWATQRIKEYIIKGFVLNDDRFKTGNSMNYFTELQERIREIRLSERFFYQKIKDIYTTAVDYDSSDKKTIEFFKIVQNKLLWAISQQTAAELVYGRVDALLPLVGMQSYDKKNVAIKKADVSVAKNYLHEDEMKLLGLLVEQYLAFAETMAQQQVPMHMSDWIEQLDSVLKMNKRELLNHAGKISHEMALEKSVEEFEKFKAEQKKLEKFESLKELEDDLKNMNTNICKN